MDRRNWLKQGLSCTLILVFAVSTILGIIAFGKDSNKKEGILTLQVGICMIFSFKS
jgi:multisubunit Na+/H+ antiporter MnhB subunit